MLWNVDCLWFIYIAKKFEHWPYNRSLFFRAVKLANNTDRDKHGCSGYGIEFDARPQFSLLNGELAEMLFLIPAITKK